MKKAQITMVLDYLLTHRGITTLQAIRKFGATRLSAIVYALKKDGYDIKDKWVTVRTRFGKTHVKRYYI